MSFWKGRKHKMYDEFKKIEAELEGEEYFCDGIGFYFFCDSVATIGDNYETLKKILITNKMIGKDDNIELVKIENPVSDFEPIGNEWHFNEQIKKRFVDILKEADVYYSLTSDDSWSTCRIIQKGDEYVLLEFFICD